MWSLVLTPASSAATAAALRHVAAAGETNSGTNVTMQTPSLSRRVSSTSSGTLRVVSQTARADECENITGTSLTRRASRMVSAETCERSTSIPMRFISRTTSCLLYTSDAADDLLCVDLGG